MHEIGTFYQVDLALLAATQSCVDIQGNASRCAGDEAMGHPFTRLA